MAIEPPGRPAPLALRRLRQPHPLRRDPHPADHGVLALRPRRGAPGGGHRGPRRVRRAGDLPLVRPLRRDRAGRAAPVGRRRARRWADVPGPTVRCRAWPGCRSRSASGWSRWRPRSLPDVPRLPPSVRRVATFAPARRARLGGRAIADGTGGRRLPRPARRPARPRARRPRPDDPAGLAAWAWLLRPEGWEAALADEVRRVADAAGPPGHRRARPAAGPARRRRPGAHGSSAQPTGSRSRS